MSNLDLNTDNVGMMAKERVSSPVVSVQEMLQLDINTYVIFLASPFSIELSTLVYLLRGGQS